MIGHVSVGNSSYNCINYCLEDKKELTEEEKQQLAGMDHLQHKDRAEVLAYYNCFGNKHELADQFGDVIKLNKLVEKPVFHFSLNLAPGETLTKNQLIEIGEACAREFKVDENQYLIIQHKDTDRQHIHIVANRVGFDGKLASDSNSYARMANLCRKLEKQYHLKEVLSPRAFLSPKEKLLPRHDIRKEQLEKDIRKTLKAVNHYPEFERRMQDLGYRVIKGRGISFIDKKKVKIKGSEVGFSLMKIEKILLLKQELAAKQKERLRQQPGERITRQPANSSQRMIFNHLQRTEKESATNYQAESQLTSLLAALLEPVHEQGCGLPYELTQEAHDRKRKIEEARRRRLSH